MRNFLIVSLFIFSISCKKEKPITNDTVIEKKDIKAAISVSDLRSEIEMEITKIIPETISNIKKHIPKIISLNSNYLEYFDLDQNNVLKVDLKTHKEEISFTPKGGGYLYFYKKNVNFTAVSNGWEGDVTTRIKVGIEDLILPNSIILDCLNEKIIITGVSEGIEVDNKTQVYNLKTKKFKPLKIKADEGKFIEENRLLVLKRFPEQQDGELIIYNLLDDNYKTILNNFSANNFVKYVEKQKKLYYVTNGLVHSISLETNEIKVVYKKSIYLPFVINDTTLTGYIYDKPKVKRNLIFVKLDPARP